MKYQILQQQHFLHIPSSSGVEIWGDTIYIVGDDSNCLFVLDKKWGILNKIPIFSAEVGQNGRISKADKPDLEAMTIWEEEGEDVYIWVIGSGSKSPQRDFSYKIASSGAVQQISFANLYKRLRKEDGIVELNIEAAIQWQGKLILFQRGGLFQQNQLILLDSTQAEYERFNIEIPLINGIQAGISGACYWAKNDILFFSATAENTTNAFDDGEICGSLIGYMRDFSKKMKKRELLINDFVILSEIPKQKIESIAISQVLTNTHLQLMAVADNDDGTSFLFEIALTL